jgi:outer membrane protein assembly factor BamB
MLFIGTLTGEVRAVELESGEEAGSKDFGTAIFGTPLLINKSVIVALSGDEETLVSYNMSAGVTVWTIPGPDVESSLLHDGGRIFVAGLDGSLRCLDALTGGEVWKFNAGGPSDPDPIRSSPACNDSLVIFGSDGGAVYALGRERGQPAWKSAVGGAVFAAPALGPRRAFISSLDGYIRALDLTDGKLLWERNLGAPIHGGAALGGGRIFAGTTGGEIFALGTGDGRVLWRVKTGGGISSAPLLSGKYLYIGDLDRNLYSLTAEAGEIVWQEELPGRVKTVPVAAGGYIVVMTDDRSVIAFRSAP